VGWHHSRTGRIRLRLRLRTRILAAARVKKPIMFRLNLPLRLARLQRNSASSSFFHPEKGRNVIISQVIETLKSDLENFPTHPLSPHLYASNVRLLEPTHTRLHLEGRQPYVVFWSGVRYILRFTYRNAYMDVISMYRESEQQNRDLVIKWSLMGSPRFRTRLWSKHGPEDALSMPPPPIFTGVSVFSFNEVGLINQQVIERIHPAPSPKWLNAWWWRWWRWRYAGRQLQPGLGCSGKTACAQFH